MVLGLLLSNCADYIAEKERLKLQKENTALEKQRQEDKATCKYYGFKADTPEFSDCLMNLDIARKQELITRKMLECEAVRRDNNQLLSKLDDAKKNYSNYIKSFIAPDGNNIGCEKIIKTLKERFF